MILEWKEQLRSVEFPFLAGAESQWALEALGPVRSIFLWPDEWTAKGPLEVE